MFKETLQNFPQQFSWEPEVINANNLAKKENTIVVGMGGSHLGADLVELCLPNIFLTIHSGYGLPDVSEKLLKNSLIILSSHSGNTEEVLDSFNTAHKQGLALAVIATGGQLLDLAIKNNIAYVKMPAENIQPRLALGYSFRAILKLLDETSTLGESDALANKLDLDAIKNQANNLSKKLQNKIPVIYSSLKNKALADIWKIKFNETSKIPAFSNTWPELNHNEMTGFDSKENTKSLMEQFHFVFLKDEKDDARILKRIDATKNILEQQGLEVTILPLYGDTKTESIFNSLLLADYITLNLAEYYGNDPEQVPLVEKFKKIIST
ncbi:MAG: SIS domain-containing protein [bacterium]|nr:SIS domain-containing protein [bacterium]